MRVAKTIFSPVGLGALQAGVFWLLGEEILHKERRDFVRRQNRGVRKICRGKKTKVSRQLFIFTSWPKAGMLLMGGLLTLCWSLRRHHDNSPILYAHKGKSSGSCADWSLARAFLHFWDGLSGLEVLINRADEVVANLLWHNFAGSPYWLKDARPSGRTSAR